MPFGPPRDPGPAPPGFDEPAPPGFDEPEHAGRDEPEPGFRAAPPPPPEPARQRRGLEPRKDLHWTQAEVAWPLALIAGLGGSWAGVSSGFPGLAAVLPVLLFAPLLAGVLGHGRNLLAGFLMFAWMIGVSGGVVGTSLDQLRWTGAPSVQREDESFDELLARPARAEPDDLAGAGDLAGAARVETRQLMGRNSLAGLDDFLLALPFARMWIEQRVEPWLGADRRRSTPDYVWSHLLLGGGVLLAALALGRIFYGLPALVIVAVALGAVSAGSGYATALAVGQDPMTMAVVLWPPHVALQMLGALIVVAARAEPVPLRGEARGGSRLQFGLAVAALGLALEPWMEPVWGAWIATAAGPVPGF